MFSIRITLIYKFQNKIINLFYKKFSVVLNDGCYKTTHHSYKINFNFEFRVKVVLLYSILVSKIK